MYMSRATWLKCNATDWQLNNQHSMQQVIDVYSHGCS